MAGRVRIGQRSKIILDFLSISKYLSHLPIGFDAPRYDPFRANDDADVFRRWSYSLLFPFLYSIIIIGWFFYIIKTLEKWFSFEDPSDSSGIQCVLSQSNEWRTEGKSNYTSRSFNSSQVRIFSKVSFSNTNLHLIGSCLDWPRYIAHWFQSLLR